MILPRRRGHERSVRRIAGDGCGNLGDFLHQSKKWQRCNNPAPPRHSSGAAPWPRKGKGALVERAGLVSQSGSGKATLSADEFVARFQEHIGVFWSIAAGIVNDRSAIDDVLQDSAMIAIRKLDDFDPSTSLVAWCGQIVRNVARNRARRERRRRGASVNMDHIVDQPSPERSSQLLRDAATLNEHQHQFDDDVLNALETLDEVARSCLLLRTLNDLSYREIAVALGIPEGTASSHVHRARRALRDRLLRREAARERGAS